MLELFTACEPVDLWSNGMKGYHNDHSIVKWNVESPDNARVVPILSPSHKEKLCTAVGYITDVNKVYLMGHYCYSSSIRNLREYYATAACIKHATSIFFCGIKTADSDTYLWPAYALILYYRSVPGKRPYTECQGVTVISRVSAHASRNRELYLSAHGGLPGTLRYVHPLIVQLYVHTIKTSPPPPHN